MLFIIGKRPYAFWLDIAICCQWYFQQFVSPGVQFHPPRIINIYVLSVVKVTWCHNLTLKTLQWKCGPETNCIVSGFILKATISFPGGSEGTESSGRPETICVTNRSADIPSLMPSSSKSWIPSRVHWTSSHKNPEISGLSISSFRISVHYGNLLLSRALRSYYGRH